MLEASDRTGEEDRSEDLSVQGWIFEAVAGRTGVLVVRGRKFEEMGRAAVCELAGRYSDTTLDLGTGDGAFVYRYARDHPERLVIGLDPVAENVREWSAKASKKAERGGLANAVYVAGSVELAPEELRGIADEVYVTLPWGSLMRGLVLGEDAVLAGVASFVAPGGRMRIVLNTRIFDEPVPIEARDLPEVTPVYVREALVAAYARHGLEIVETRELDGDEVVGLGTTWAKRLSHRRAPRSVLIECERPAPGD